MIKLNDKNKNINLNFPDGEGKYILGVGEDGEPTWVAGPFNDFDKHLKALPDLEKDYVLESEFQAELKAQEVVAIEEKRKAFKKKRKAKK